MLENAFGYGCAFGIVTFLCLSIAIVDELFRINSSTNQPEKISLGKEPILQYEASSGKVIYQDKTVLSLRVGSTNYRFIDYMFRNADRSIHLEELYKSAALPSNKYISKLLADTKLPKDLRERAFIIENNTIKLRTSFDV